jgi:hypothetical protein
MIDSVWARAASRGGLRLEVSERDYVVATKSKKPTVASISVFTQTELGT